MSRILHRTTADRPPLAMRGEGIYLFLSNGQRIIDASGGAAVAVLGHGNRRVANALAEQAAKLAYAHTGFFSSEPAEVLADLLVGKEPGGLTHAFFVSSGSEAIESALKLARQYFVEKGEPRRIHYIARRQSYHGNTFGSLGASGHVARRSIYEPVLPAHFSHVSPCYSYHYQERGEDEQAYVARLAAELDAEFRGAGADRVAAFIAEPVVGAAAGCVTAVPGYFRAVREVCDRYGALLILDEVMCGMGRTGTTHAWEQEGVVPDIQAIAKGLAGGYAPVGGILVSGGVIRCLAGGSGAFIHGHTYQAHPVACAAALEVQRIIEEEGLIARVRQAGAYLESKLRATFGDHPFVGDIRGRGLFWALEFVEDRERRTPFAPELRMFERVKQAALARQVGIYPSSGAMDGRAGDAAIIAPPYTVREEEIDLIVERLAPAIDDAVAGARNSPPASALAGSRVVMS